MIAMDTTPLFAAAPSALDRRFLEPEDFRWGQFIAGDGTRLRWGYLPAGSTRDCVLVGGFMEFIEKYFETARDFRARGYNVWCLDWRDQGRSSRTAPHPQRPAARRYGRDADDLAAFIAKSVPRDNQCLLAAHSMGAAIALLMLSDHAALVDAAVLSAPMLALETGNVPRWAAKALARLMTAAGRADRFVPGAGPWSDRALTPATSRVSNDPARCRLQDAWFAAAPDLRLDGLTYGWLDAAFRLTARLARPSVLARIATPILIGSAGQDLLVDPTAHVHAAAALPNCRLVAFSAAKHELFHETDEIRDRWFAAIDAFAGEHIRPW